MPWDQAPATPRKPKTETPWWAYAIVIGIIAVVGICVARVNSGSSEVGSEEMRADAKRACQEEFIPDRLKAPKTAAFSDVKILPVGGGYTVSGSVDSQNAFGALVRASFTCSVHLDGDQWILDLATVNG